MKNTDLRHDGHEAAQDSEYRTGFKHPQLSSGPQFP